MRLSQFPNSGRGADDRDAFRISLSDALRPLSDPVEIQDTAAALLGRYLGANRSYYAAIDAGGRSASGEGAVPALISRVMAAGRPLVVENIAVASALTEAERDAYVALDAVAVVAVPILEDERCTAVLSISQNEPRSWTAEEIALIAETGERARVESARAREEAIVRASEQRFRALFESIDQGVALIQLVRSPEGEAIDYRVLEANERSAHLFTGGAPAAGPSHSLVFERDPFWLGAFDLVAHTGDPARFERYLPSIARWFSTCVSQVEYEGTDRLLVVFDDVTERRFAENSHRKIEERHAYLLELTDGLRPLADPVAIQVAASHRLGRHLDVERAFYCEIASDDRHMVIAREYRRGVASIEGTHRLSEFGPRWIESLRSGKSLIVADTQTAAELSRSERDNYASLDMHSVLAVPLIKDDRWLGCLMVASSKPRGWSSEDIFLVAETGDRTWAALERARAEQALRDADRRKDEFLAMLAHELRNPLAPIRNNAQLLQMAGDERIRAAGEMVQRQVVQMVRLIDDLLDVNRISRGKVELRIERVELSVILRQAVERIWPVVTRMGHDLAVTIPPRPIYLNGDPSRLMQVLDNLLQNAVKFMTHEGRIALVLVRHEDQAVIQVRDSGIGISFEHLPSIFELFMQADTSLERPAGGLGIGLTLVKRLIELHGGSVEARSEGIGRGSEFTVRIPVLPEAETEPLFVPSGEPQPPAARRVLVVDDNRDGAESLALLLKYNGHETRVAHDGLEALEVAEQFRPDVALLDIGLPKLNGYEACRRIRAEPWGRGMVLVALTGWGHEEHRRLSRDAGFDHHVVKPLNVEQLAGILASAGVRYRAE